jgi:hypothetical protein
MWEPRVTRHTSIRQSISVQTVSSMSLFMVATVPPSKCQDSTLNQVTTASFDILSSSLFINRPFILCCII